MEMLTPAAPYSWMYLERYWAHAAWWRGSSTSPGLWEFLMWPLLFNHPGGLQGVQGVSGNHDKNDKNTKDNNSCNTIANTNNTSSSKTALTIGLRKTLENLRNTLRSHVNSLCFCSR